MGNEICKEHSGFLARIKDLEDNVSKLWAKWDNMQKMVVGIFVMLSMTLISVVFLLLRTRG